MLTYKTISLFPQTFVRLIGMTILEFDHLDVAFEKAYREKQSKRNKTLRGQRPRLRKVGGGRPSKYELRDRLILTLFWMKARPTYKVLGELYNINRATASSIIKEIAPVLHKFQAVDSNYDEYQPKRFYSKQSLLVVYPEIGKLRELNTKGGKM